MPYNFPASGFPRKVWTHWHAAFVRNKTGEDLTSLSSTSPERDDESLATDRGTPLVDGDHEYNQPPFIGTALESVKETRQRATGMTTIAALSYVLVGEGMVPSEVTDEIRPGTG